MRGARSEGGQASVQLVAIVPALVIATLLVAQLALAGHALWSAGTAARAGARAAHVGGGPRRVALRALPPGLRAGAEVRRQGGGVRVRVRVPSLLPGIPRVPLVASTALMPGSGDG